MTSSSSSDLEDVIETIFDDEDEQGVIETLTQAVAVIRSSTVHCGSLGRVRNSITINRGPCSWYTDYLAPHPRYPPSNFRSIFRIPLSLYNQLHDEILGRYAVFGQQKDAVGKGGHTTHQKLLSPLRRLATGLSFKQMDDMARMSVESQRKYFRLFLLAMKQLYGSMLLNRAPVLLELREIESKYAQSGFPGCIGCIDCMHLHWKNCPKEFKGQYHNPKSGKLATISCEALVDTELYCWHWFAGRAGTNNDITVMDNSPLFNDILGGERRMTLPEGYVLNGQCRKWLLYMLGDGIYPEWAILVLPIHSPLNQRYSYMTKCQEGRRKDVERFFGCLQGRFKILRQERHEWSDADIILISDVCVIIHNMIVKISMTESQSSEDTITNSIVDEFFYSSVLTSVTSGDEDSHGAADHSTGLAALLDRNILVTSKEDHIRLTEELSLHLWNIRGGAD